MIIDFTASEAAQAALYRRTIRRFFYDWCVHCGYRPARHHRFLIEYLTAVAEGKIRNLMIFMPPGAGKSIYTSILFVVWYLTNFPTRSVIAACHTLEFAEKWGRRNRNIFAEHCKALGVPLSPDSQAAGRWSLASGGEYLAAGVGSAITGFRADLGLIDDPVKSREDADSKIMRDRAWEWFKSDFCTRLKPDGAKILIQNSLA